MEHAVRDVTAHAEQRQRGAGELAGAEQLGQSAPMVESADSSMRSRMRFRANRPALLTPAPAGWPPRASGELGYPASST